MSQVSFRCLRAAVIVASVLIAPALSNGDDLNRDGNRGSADNLTQLSSARGGALIALGANHIPLPNTGNWTSIVDGGPLAMMPVNGGALAFAGLLLAGVAAGTRKGRRNLAALVSE